MTKETISRYLASDKAGHKNGQQPGIERALGISGNEPRRHTNRACGEAPADRA